MTDIELSDLLRTSADEFSVPGAAELARPYPTTVSAVSQNAMVSTDHPLSTNAGLEVLRSGGSAVDAYIAAAATQTVIEPTMTSLAGVFSVTVYEPSTGQTRQVGGLGGRPAAETGDLDDAARWSGRTVVTPGWVRSAHCAWEKWGKLGWADLLSGALRSARDGFVLDQPLWARLFEGRLVAGRSAAGREVWFPDGRLASVGSVVRQPALARTIEQLAEGGLEYFYEGEFARNLVATARAAGGQITLDDMAATYGFTDDIVVRAVPTATGYEVHSGGLMYPLALNLAAAGGLGTRAGPTEDPETLYQMMRIIEEVWHLGLSLANGWEASDEAVEEMARIAAPEGAQQMWPQVESGPPRAFDAMNVNTNAIVVVDESGTIAFGTHSTAGSPFGAGLIVDGVSLPRAMYLYANPVLPLPVGWATSMLAVRDGRPIFVAGSPGEAAVQNVFQNAMNVLEWGMDPGESVSRPRFGAPLYPSSQVLVEATMGDDLLGEVARRGIPILPVSPMELAMASCQAVGIDDDGTLRGAADPRRYASASGY